MSTEPALPTPLRTLLGGPKFNKLDEKSTKLWSNFQMRFWTLIKPNLAPTWPPKSIQNRSQDDVKTQLPENLIFATPPMRNARFCFPKGLPKRSKMHSKTTWNTLAFSTSKKHPPSFDFAPTWLPLGPPKALPRGLQGLLKITLGSILGHLSCKFQFLASQGVPPGNIF